MKIRFSKKIVVGVSLGLALFTFAVLVVYWHTGAEPAVLIGAVFGYAVNQLWQLAGIKRAEIKKGEKENDI